MHTTSSLVNQFFYILCNEGHFPEFTIIFPPLIPTINLVFPAFTFNPLSRMLALQSVTCLLSCSIVGAISNNSSTYNKWPLIQTRLPSLSPAYVRTAVDTMQAHPHPSSSKPISKPLSGQISSLNLQKHSTASSLHGVSLLRFAWWKWHQWFPCQAWSQNEGRHTRSRSGYITLQTA